MIVVDGRSLWIGGGGNCGSALRYNRTNQTSYFLVLGVTGVLKIIERFGVGVPVTSPMGKLVAVCTRVY